MTPDTRSLIEQLLDYALAADQREAQEVEDALQAALDRVETWQSERRDGMGPPRSFYGDAEDRRLTEGDRLMDERRELRERS